MAFRALVFNFLYLHSSDPALRPGLITLDRGARGKMIAVIAIIRAAWEFMVRLNAGPGKMSPGGQNWQF